MSRALLAALLCFAASAAAAQQEPFPLPPKDWPKPVMDTERFTYLLLDRFEYRARRGHDAWAWDAQGWWGGDYNKLWFKSEGEGEWRGAAERRARRPSALGRAARPAVNPAYRRRDT